MKIHQFIDDFPTETSIYRPFPIATLDYQKIPEGNSTFWYFFKSTIQLYRFCIQISPGHFFAAEMPHTWCFWPSQYTKSSYLGSTGLLGTWTLSSVSVRLSWRLKSWRNPYLQLCSYSYVSCVKSQVLLQNKSVSFLKATLLLTSSLFFACEIMYKSHQPAQNGKKTSLKHVEPP